MLELEPRAVQENNKKKYNVSHQPICLCSDNRQPLKNLKPLVYKKLRKLLS